MPAAVVWSAPFAVIGSALDGTISSWNPAAERLYGYTELEVSGQPVSRLFAGGESDDWAHIWAQGLEGLTIERRDAVHMRKDGTVFPAGIMVSPILAPDLEVVGAAIFARDVSDEQRTEAAQQTAKASFSDLLDSAPDSVVITDARGVIVLVNREVEHKFGYPREALIGQPVEVLIPERFQARHVEHRATYRRNPRTRPMGAGLELFARHSDGHEFPVEVSLSPTQAAGRNLVIGIVRDISERRRLEREKDELLATVTHILDGVTDAVFAVDLQGNLTRINNATARLVGRPMEELIGHPARDIFRWEDEAGRLLDEDEYAYRQSLAKDEPVVLTDLYFRRADGTRLPVAVSAAPIIDPERNIAMAVVLVRDISREREAEELKDRIISLVSHELRTPIGHIKGFASSLLERDVRWDSATQQDFISEIDREADRLATLVTDLLDMSKIESGSDFLQKDTHHPADIVRQALAAVEKMTGGHTVVNEVGDDLLVLIVDGSAIERVVSNLVENAAKYSEPGTEIRVTGQRLGPDLQICVADQGPGVPFEYRDKIFERFFRIKTGRPSTPGTGLGLPICRGIVEAHGGRLWLESAEGRGSRFCFTLPLDP